MRRHSKKKGLHSSRQSVFFYRDLEGRDDPELTHPDYFSRVFPYALVQDVTSSIIPVSALSKDHPFQVTITPPDQSVEELIMAGIAQQDYPQDLERVIYDFVHGCTQTIMVFGEAAYEIVYYSDPADGKIDDFQLAFIPSQTVRPLGGELVQYVPADVAEKRGVPRYIPLSTENICIFKPSKEVQCTLDEILDSLAELSGSIVPAFAFNSIRGADKVPYDLNEHHRLRMMAVASATKRIGWNGRGLLREDTLEFYWLHRKVVFQEFIIKFRNNILQTLNEVLKRAGEELGFSAQLKIEGMLTLEDLDVIRAQLITGSLPFKDVSEQLEQQNY